MASIVRSMARSMARENMRKAGYAKIVRSGFFSKNWRKFVNVRRKKGRKRNGDTQI